MIVGADLELDFAEHTASFVHSENDRLADRSIYSEPLPLYCLFSSVAIASDRLLRSLPSSDMHNVHFAASLWSSAFRRLPRRTCCTGYAYHQVAAADSDAAVTAETVDLAANMSACEKSPIVGSANSSDCRYWF